MTDTCPICVETFTEQTRKQVTCPYCQHSTCVKCLKQFILNTQQNPNCMNCHVEFNREFLDIHLTVTFRTKEYKQHRENVLLEREKSMLPATVPFVEQEIERRQRVVQIQELNDRKAELNRQIDELNTSIRNLYNHTHLHAAADAQVERKQFIKACVVDGCRGFLSSQWKCGVCETWVCPDCHEPKNGQKDEEHVCNPDNVASARVIAKETKPCPKCAACIFRVSGCSQMWCPQCHTTFDWNTGRQVVTNNIHNPHYYDWLRRQNNGQEIPRVPGDNPCVDRHAFPRAYIMNHINKWRSHDARIDKVGFLHRSITHMRDYDIIREHNINIEETNRGLRVKYMLNELNEQEWKKELQKREKKRDFDVSKSRVCDMLLQVGTELFNSISQAKHITEVKGAIDQLEAIVAHYNESMQKVYDSFNSKAKKLILDDTWDFSH